MFNCFGEVQNNEVTGRIEKLLQKKHQTHPTQPQLTNDKDIITYNTGVDLLIRCLRLVQTERCRYLGNLSGLNNMTLTELKWYVCRYPSLGVAYLAIEELANQHAYKDTFTFSSSKIINELNRMACVITEQQRLMLLGMRVYHADNEHAVICPGGDAHPVEDSGNGNGDV